MKFNSPLSKYKYNFDKNLDEILVWEKRVELINDVIETANEFNYEEPINIKGKKGLITESFDINNSEGEYDNSFLTVYTKENIQLNDKINGYLVVNIKRVPGIVNMLELNING